MKVCTAKDSAARASLISLNQTSASGAYVFHSTGSSEFNHQTAIEKLTKLKLNCYSHPSLVMNMAGDSALEADISGSAFGSNQGNLRLGSLINLSSRLSVSLPNSAISNQGLFLTPSQIGCAGAILSELQRRRASECLYRDQDVSAAHAIRTITMFDLANSMFLNDDTLDALQILRSESHPDSQKGGPDKSSSGAKESLSVYGLFQRHARTPQGKAKLKQTFLRPSTDMGLLGERHRIIAILLRPENSETFTMIIKHMRMIKNMKAIMSHIQRGVDKPSSLAPAKRGVWKSLQRFSKFTVELYETVRVLETGGAPLEVVNRVSCATVPGTRSHLIFTRRCRRRLIRARLCRSEKWSRIRLTLTLPRLSTTQLSSLGSVKILIS